MNENYTFTKDVQEWEIFQSKDYVVEKLYKVQRFIEDALWQEKYREDSTSGMHLDEIEDLEHDLERFIDVYDAVTDASLELEDYTVEYADDHIGRELMSGKYKMDGVETILEGIASKLMDQVQRHFIYLCPPGTEYEERNGLWAFWPIED